MRRFLPVLLALLLACAPLARAAEEDWTHVLLLGGDARDMRRYDRSDAMLILSVRGDGGVKLTSILRDTWVNFPGRKSPGKINAATVYGGPELAMATVNQAFGTELARYALVNMEDMVKLIDLLGGVDIEITEAERREINVYAAGYTGEPYQGERTIDRSGRVHLNGLLAMSYCRLRYIDSDYRRVMRQQAVLLAMARRARELKPAELAVTAAAMLGNVKTNLTPAELASLGRALLAADPEDVGQFRIPADGTFRAGMRGGTWRIDPDFERNAELLREFIYEN